MIEQEQQLVDLVSGYDSVFLVANNPNVDTRQLDEVAPDDALFVFYNAVNVITETFRRPSLVCHRSKSTGRFVLSRRTRSNADAKFEPGSVKATIRVIIGNVTAEKSMVAFGDHELAMLTAPLYRGWYSNDKMPTVGFASVLWFLKHARHVNLNLVGFSGAFNPQFRMDTHSHDWVLEQAVMQIEEELGNLVRLRQSGSVADLGQALKRRYPDVETGKLAVVCADVLSRRQYASDSALASVWRRVHPLQELRRRTARLLPSSFLRRLVGG